MTEDQVRELLELLHINNRRVNVRRTGTNYLKMFTEFEGLWTDTEGADRIQSQLAEQLAYGVLQQPIQLGSLPILLRLLAIDPSYPVALANGFVRHRFLD
jgi:hypothetical protein